MIRSILYIVALLLGAIFLCVGAFSQFYIGVKMEVIFVIAAAASLGAVLAATDDTHKAWGVILTLVSVLLLAA